jgi:hypothetical protein
LCEKNNCIIVPNGKIDCIIVTNEKIIVPSGNGILLPKLFWPTVRKNCSSDREKLLKLEAEGREFAKNLRSQLEFKLEKLLGFRNMQEKLENIFFRLFPIISISQ